MNPEEFLEHTPVETLQEFVNLKQDIEENNKPAS